MTDGWHDAWSAALEELELDLSRAEALLRAGEPPEPDVTPWTPPQGLGPLPAELAPRARELLERQLETAAALSRVMLTNRRHAALADRMQSHEPRRPLYVDRAY